MRAFVDRSAVYQREYVRERKAAGCPVEAGAPVKTPRPATRRPSATECLKASARAFDKAKASGRIVIDKRTGFYVER